MKSLFFASILLSLNLMAARHSAIGSYYQNATLHAEVIQQQRNLILQFSTGCSAVLRERTDGSLAGSCNIGSGYNVVQYTGIIRSNGKNYTLTYQVIDYSHADLSNQQIFVAHQR